METALITGVAGLLGNHLSRHLLARGWRVIGLDNLTGGYRDHLPEHDNFVFFEIDLLETASVQQVFRAYRPTVVYHFAAYAAEGLSPFIRVFNYQNNLIASAVVINNCIEFDAKLVFTSSMAVYGDQPGPFEEGMARRPIDPYGIAKAAVENDIEVAATQHGLRYSIVRPHNVIGIFQNVWDNYRNVVGIFLRRAILQEPIILFGGGRQLRAFSDISFYLQPFEILASRGDGEIFNLGSDQKTSIRDLATLVADVAGQRGFAAKIEEGERRHEVFEAYCAHAKAESVLGFRDKTDLRSTVGEMLSWVISEPDRPVKSMPYEIDKGLYSYWKA